MLVAVAETRAFLITPDEYAVTKQVRDNIRKVFSSYHYVSLHVIPYFWLIFLSSSISRFIKSHSFKSLIRIKQCFKVMERRLTEISDLQRVHFENLFLLPRHLWVRTWRKGIYFDRYRKAQFLFPVFRFLYCYSNLVSGRPRIVCANSWHFWEKD